MIPFAHVIQRKAINSNGTVGSLYNVIEDQILPSCHINRCDPETINTRAKWQIVNADRDSDIIGCLQKMAYQDQLLESLVCKLVVPNGISSLIDCPDPLDPEMILLYYSCATKKHDLFSKINEKYRELNPTITLRSATHIITKVIWGFEILCLISPKSDTRSSNIVSNLTRIMNKLNESPNNFQLKNEETEVLQKLSVVKVYSSAKLGLSDLSLIEIFESVYKWQKDTSRHQPIDYELDSLSSLLKGRHDFRRTNNIPYSTSLQTLRYIWQIDVWMKQMNNLLEPLKKQDLGYSLAERQNNLMQKYEKALEYCERFNENCRETLLRIRDKNLSTTFPSHSLVNNIDQMLPSSSRKELIDAARRLSIKVEMIEKLKQQQILYINSVDIYENTVSSTRFESMDMKIRQYLSKRNRDFILWYSNDWLKETYYTEWKKTFEKVQQEIRENAGSMRAFYIDCDNVQIRLSKNQTFTIKQDPSPIKTVDNNPNRAGRPSHESTITVTGSESAEPRSGSVNSNVSKTQHKRMINVLLLGESGVGKSTFINALVNYLRFGSLEDAENGKPTVVIPVSFYTTIGEKFDEFLVKFGEIDPNEKHNELGQSVTQTCRSYRFSIKENIELRLIDTPGMCDTRGVDRDRLNIKQIVNYIEQYSHLDAVCFLMNPNQARLNIWLRSLLHQLLTIIDPEIKKNINFCFTNSRSSFYTPGNSGAILKKYLQESYADIKFTKKNVFCFDSEAFRYLISTGSGLKFDENFRKDFFASWERSTTESVRLLNAFIDSSPAEMNVQLTSERIILEMQQLARMIAETIRMKIYNHCLQMVQIVDHRIKIQISDMDNSMCSNCAETELEILGPLKIHQYTSKKKLGISFCSCQTQKESYPIDLFVHFQYVKQKNETNMPNEVVDLLTSFYRLCSKESRFTNVRRILTLIFDQFLRQQVTILDKKTVYTNVDMNVDDMLKWAYSKNRELPQSITTARKFSDQELFENILQMKKSLIIPSEDRSNGPTQQKTDKNNEIQIDLKWQQSSILQSIKS